MSLTHKPPLPSERRFGVLFTFLFAFAAVYGYLKGWQPSMSVAFGVVGLLFALTTLLSPKLLAPLNRWWFLLGELLGKIVSPIVLGVIFFGVLTPIGLITRAFGRDPLRLKKRSIESEWIERNAPSPHGDMFKNQF